MENEDEMDQSDFNDNEPESTRQEKPGQLRRPFSLLLQENGGAGENSFPAFVNRSATPEAVPSKTSLPLVGQVARGIIKVVQVAQRFTGWRRFVWLAAGSVLLALASSALAKWDAENSGTKSSLRAVHNASPGVAWAGGTNGVILRSEDDGYLWQQCAIPPGAENLDFRGVWGWNADHAIAMSSGPGSASRLYETTDGCAHWRSAFANPEPAGFWDAIAFWNQQQGMLLGDPVNGRFRIFKTSDGGRHWSRDESAGLEIDPGGESAFAASNSALVLGPDGMSAYFATGGTGGCRIFRFHPGVRGQPGSWTSAKLPLAHNAESAGIFSLAFRDSKRGVAVGGDYKQPNQIENTTAWTSDGGLTWAGASKPPSGYRSAVAWDRNSQAWIAVGPNGSDVSYDDGKTWRQFDRASWNALSLPWVVGPDGRIAMLNRSALDKSLK
ncbi:MAG TPA: hypothetical protein VHZ55_26980 [Bryobacteraceae bacterium]|jgi:photosystem II stability/assembly factor-like uncharacterized protein|nr:hypothetical protein [Bryobacteraceae bacterium]